MLNTATLNNILAFTKYIHQSHIYIQSCTYTRKYATFTHILCVHLPKHQIYIAVQICSIKQSYSMLFTLLRN